MTRTASIVTALVFALVLSACIADFDDVSSLAEYRDAIGKTCQVRIPINGHGVALIPEREKKTELISLSSLNLSGPEITFGAQLVQGTSLKVVAVRKCRNCPFDERIEYQVLVDPKPPVFGDVPVYLNLQRVKGGAVLCQAWQSASPNPSLQPTAFGRS